MKIIQDNIWKYHGTGYIIIPTNGLVKNNGECVMGAGLAKQAKIKYPTLPKELGHQIKNSGNHVYHWDLYGLITFPVKHNWFDSADMTLIEQSSVELAQYYEDGFELGAQLPKIYMPKVGCGNGNLKWEDVQTIIMAHLSHIITLVDNDSYGSQSTN